MPARRYPDELREREVGSTGRPVAHVARDLGIHEEALRSWVRQAEADTGEREDRLTTAERPNQLWPADLPCVRTWSGWVHVTFVPDAYSRRIVGRRAAAHPRTDLPLDAPEMAPWRQRIKKDADLIHHSDRGSQYVSIRYTERLAEVGASASVGSVADSVPVGEEILRIAPSAVREPDEIHRFVGALDGIWSELGAARQV